MNKHEIGVNAAKKAFYREMDAGLGVERAIEAYLEAAALSPLPSPGNAESPSPSSQTALPSIDGGRFETWSLADIAGQCRMQSREQLDPEFSQFMAEVAKRLSALAASADKLVGSEKAIRKAGQVAIDDLIERGSFQSASDDDLADYMMRIVDACVRAAH